MAANDEIMLCMPHDEASRKLQYQITKGEQLLQTFPQTTGSPEPFRKFEENKQLWSDYTAQLLRSMFSTKQVSLDYQTLYNTGPLDGLRKKILYLRSLRQRLELIPEHSQSLRGDANYDLQSLHGEIYSKCHDLFEHKSYAEAVEKGFKVVKDRLRQLTGHESGSDAFGKGKLHIKGAAAPHVDQDFNAGVKFLTMAIDRFRNEKSHTSDARIEDSKRAYEYLRLSSLAMHLLEDAEVLKD